VERGKKGQKERRPVGELKERKVGLPVFPLWPLFELEEK
jgi:hypothetical protein